MAISAVHYRLVRGMFEKGILPQQGALLEIGEANMYGDLPPHVIDDDIRRYVADETRRDQLLRRHAQLNANPNDESVPFDKAKLFYEIFFSPTEIQAVDFSGTPIAQKLDLNGPIKLNRKFEVVINHGTAEHVFNIAQVFRTMHEYTVPNGMMIHEAPFSGWIEHGFYNLQPTLFFDLADFNQYEILGMYLEELRSQSALAIKSREDVYDYAQSGKIADNLLLFVVFRKHLSDRPFQFPIQGYYRDILPQRGQDAWREMR
jgi:hypothetical protein